MLKKIFNRRNSNSSLKQISTEIAPFRQFFEIFLKFYVFKFIASHLHKIQFFYRNYCCVQKYTGCPINKRQAVNRR